MILYDRLATTKGAPAGRQPGLAYCQDWGTMPGVGGGPAHGQQDWPKELGAAGAPGPGRGLEQLCGCSSRVCCSHSQPVPTLPNTAGSSWGILGPHWLWGPMERSSGEAPQPRPPTALPPILPWPPKPSAAGERALGGMRTEGGAVVTMGWPFPPPGLYSAAPRDEMPSQSSWLLCR